MTSTARINADDVRAGLRAINVLEHYGAKFVDEKQIRLTECPRCRQRSRREAIVVDRQTGSWIHHSGASADGATCKGDVLELVAAFEGIDRKRDFRRLLELAAPIAGVTPDTGEAEHARRREDRRREDAEHARAQAAKRAAAQAAVPGRWAALDRRSLIGERYLANRGIQPAELVARDLVRFAPNGDPSVLLYDFATGEQINILRRQIEGAPKVLASTDCSTDGSILGRITEIDPDGVDVAVLLEGVTDSLAAALAFPGCAILGASGASKLAAVAAAVAPRLLAARGWLLIVPDADDVGASHAADAIDAAVRAGLTLAPADAGLDGASTVRIVDLGEHHDLADAWRAGWRWQWPQGSAS